MIMFCSSPQLRPAGNTVGIARWCKVCIGNAATDDFLQHGLHLPRTAKVVLHRQFQVEAFAWHANCRQSRRQSCTARKEFCCTNPARRLRILRGGRTTSGDLGFDLAVGQAFMAIKEHGVSINQRETAYLSQLELEPGLVAEVMRIIHRHCHFMLLRHTRLVGRSSAMPIHTVLAVLIQPQVQSKLYCLFWDSMKGLWYSVRRICNIYIYTRSNLNAIIWMDLSVRKVMTPSLYLLGVPCSGLGVAK